MLRKNNGHVLVIVLFILTIAFILISGLFSLTINTRKQVGISEINMQKTNAAEMGISLFEKNVTKVIQTKNYKTVQDLMKQLSDNLLPLQGSRMLDNNLSYKISNISISSKMDDSQKNTLITIMIECQGIYQQSLKTLDKTFTLKIPNGNSDGNSSGAYTDKNQFNEINNSNFPDLSPVLKGTLTQISAQNVNNCQFNTDVYFNYGNNIFQNNCVHAINGSAKFEYTQLNENATITINNDAQFNRSIKLYKNSEIIIGRNALYNDSVEFYESGTKLSIGGDSRFNNAFLSTNSQINLAGNSLFDNSLELNGSNLLIEKNAYFSRNVRQTSSTITIGGSANFTNDINLDKNSVLIIKGNFYKNPKQYITINGTVCVYGNSDIADGPSSTNANIIRNVTSCGKSTGTIYILNQLIQNDNNIGNITVEFQGSPVHYH